VVDTIDTTIGTTGEKQPCLLCGKDAVVIINGTASCGEHLDRVMAQAFAMVYRLIGRLTYEARPELPDDVDRADGGARHPDPPTKENTNG
jgi:hypothetical protein